MHQDCWLWMTHPITGEETWLGPDDIGALDDMVREFCAAQSPWDVEVHTTTTKYTVSAKTWPAVLDAAVLLITELCWGKEIVSILAFRDGLRPSVVTQPPPERRPKAKDPHPDE